LTNSKNIQKKPNNVTHNNTSKINNGSNTNSIDKTKVKQITPVQTSKNIQNSSTTQTSKPIPSSTYSSSSITENKNKQEIQKKIYFKNGKSDTSDTLDNDFLPKNYGNKWSDEDKASLIDLLKKSTSKEIDYAGIALKLARSEGGVKGEVKKMILKRYLNGEEADLIALDLNVQYKFVKILIKSYIDNEITYDISNLEKENQFLKLKIENMELRKNMQKLTKKQT
jgi:hypothetical protein